MENEAQKNSYPLLTFPKTGTVLFPFRRLAGGSSNRIAKAFVLRLREWLPKEIEVLDDVWVNYSEQMSPMKVEIALLKSDEPDYRVDVEIDVPYDANLKPVHFKNCGDGFRDALMSRLGWTVVRFGGNQLLSNPKACADFLMNLDDASILPQQTTWTRSEALKMASKELVGLAQRSFPEEPLPPQPLMSFSDEELRYLPLVEPFPRTMDMQQKMAGFTDAGLYIQDEDIDFEPEEHIYLYQGRQRLLPVSSLIACFFDEFDALAVAVNQWRYKGIPIEESLDLWEKSGRMASEVGTFVHAQTENYFCDGVFETRCPFCYGGETEMVNVERECQHFLHFIEDYHIHPYRQEWPIYDKELNIAGTIDLICQEVDGDFTIYDWKRSTKVVNAFGQPVVEAYEGRMSKGGINLPDTAFYHYCLQQNLYRYMLEKNYGIHVKAMNLVVLHPDYPTYYVAPVPKMDEVIQQMLSICKMKDLGHQLLHNYK
jgi:hypothetical protein